MNGPVTVRGVETMLHLLTLLFGVLELPGVTVHGVWRGKDGLDWQRAVETRLSEYDAGASAEV